MSYIWVSYLHNEIYCPQIQLNLILFLKIMNKYSYIAREARKTNFVRWRIKISGMGGTPGQALMGGTTP